MTPILIFFAGFGVGVFVAALGVAARHGDQIMHDLATYDRGVADGMGIRLDSEEGGR